VRSPDLQGIQNKRLIREYLAREDPIFCPTCKKRVKTGLVRFELVGGKTSSRETSLERIRGRD
jgi:hypothetical protein